MALLGMASQKAYFMVFVVRPCQVASYPGHPRPLPDDSAHALYHMAVGKGCHWPRVGAVPYPARALSFYVSM